MAKDLSSTKNRKKLGKKSFALPGKRKYPIPDKLMRGTRLRESHRTARRRAEESKGSSEEAISLDWSAQVEADLTPDESPVLVDQSIAQHGKF
jgi:hypothetical protein